MRGRHLLGLSVLLLLGCGAKIGEEGVEPGDGGTDSAVTDGATDGIFADGGTCGVGACVEGTVCSPDDGCNQCSCTGGGWTCTLRACVDAGPSPKCPPIEPKTGMPCAAEGLACGYTNACGLPDKAVCSGGTWHVDASLCSGTCPISEPTDGASCTGEGATCTYSNGCGGTDSALCKDKRWWLVRGPCTTPGCPPSEPAAGTSCSAPVKCAYTSACGGYDVAYCGSAGSTWSVTKAPCPTPTCPPVEPAAGTACAGPIKCSYKNSCGGTDSATCSGTSSKWAVGIGPCSTTCPPTKPPAFSPCVAGSSCEWNNGCGAVTYGYCDGATGWNFKEPGCIPGCPASKPTTGTSCMGTGFGSCSYLVSKGCSTSCFCSDVGTWACLATTCSGGGAADAGPPVPPSGP